MKHQDRLLTGPILAMIVLSPIIGNAIYGEDAERVGTVRYARQRMAMVLRWLRPIQRRCGRPQGSRQYGACDPRRLVEGQFRLLSLGRPRLVRRGSPGHQHRVQDLPGFLRVSCLRREQIVHSTQSRAGLIPPVRTPAALTVCTALTPSPDWRESHRFSLRRRRFARTHTIAPLHQSPG